MPAVETAFYDLVGVAPTATHAEIRKAYRVRALQCHPDRAGDSAEATVAFQRLQRVYEVLADEESRRLYDEHGESGLEGTGDLAAAASFFANLRTVSKEDIEEYEDVYRGGADELEDLVQFFERFEGDVSAVVDYVPYSSEGDLTRFVGVWDGLVEEGRLDGSRKYTKNRRVLLARGKGKEREVGAGAKKDAPGKSSAADRAAENDLMLAIRARSQARAAGFDAWADSLAEKYKEKPKKKKAKARKSKSAASAAASSADGEGPDSQRPPSPDARAKSGRVSKGRSFSKSR